MIKNKSPQTIVIPMYSLYWKKRRIFSEAQAMITVTEEAISTNVLKVPTGTFNRPIGQ